MRRLKSEELYSGIYVQTASIGDLSNPTVYQIIIENGRYYYTALESDWKMDGELVKENWYETEITIKLNRSNKIDSILS